MMPSIRRLAVVTAFALALTACGGGTGATTTTSTSTTTSSTTTTTIPATSTTTEPAPTGTIADLVGDQVEDPLLGTGFHEMEWADAAMSYLRSTAPVDGSTGEQNRLAVGEISPEPAVGGLGDAEFLVEAWIDDYDGGIVPFGVVVYAEGPAGWVAGTVITSDAVLEYVETTTDYMARGPGGTPMARFTVSQFDAAGGPHFIADVTVSDAGDPSDTFEAEIECVYGDPLDCTLLSDDGVLRPGDEGEDVEALQEKLIAVGYYSGPIDGEYDDDVTDAVREFQRDHRLAVDGRAGPNTQEVLNGVVDGSLGIVMASQAGVGDVLFGVDDATSYAELIQIFGSPTDTTGWYVDACDGHDWFKASWDGFTAIFTDRDGFRQFDGWEVTDLGDVVEWLYFKGGIAPGWTWDDLDRIGAEFEPTYGGFWFHDGLGYNNGSFTSSPATDPPPDGAAVAGFGTGTGAFVSC